MRDTLSSVVVALAAVFSRWRFGPYLDPAASILVIVVILRSSWGLLRDTTRICSKARRPAWTWKHCNGRVHPAVKPGVGAQTIEISGADQARHPFQLPARSRFRRSRRLIKKLAREPAIEIMDPTGFVNASSSFKLADLIGKQVVLLDFWTYSCINCIRTIPYLNAWYYRYQTKGSRLWESTRRNSHLRKIL